MSNTLLLLYHYLRHHRYKTIVMVLSMTIIFYLPLTLYLLINQYHHQLTARADSTPVIVGPKGSRFDLIFHSLYFRPVPNAGLTMQQANAITQTGLALPIPLHGLYTARDHTIIGTTLDYFKFRNVKCQSGSPFTFLGDCVLGSTAARTLNLSVGDHLLSDPVNVFDIAGEFPLKMKVTGILSPTGTADDQAVFVDLKTAWIIQGIGHGHQDLTTTTDQNVILKKDKSSVVANAALMQYMQVTSENINEFHFHGTPDKFPITAIICIPNDKKSQTILAGRYQNTTDNIQLLIPNQVVKELFNYVFKIKQFFDLNSLFVFIANLLLLILVILLSKRLRQREITTMVYLGCSKSMIFKLLAAEILVIITLSAILTILLTSLTILTAHNWLSYLIFV